MTTREQAELVKSIEHRVRQAGDLVYMNLPVEWVTSILFLLTAAEGERDRLQHELARLKEPAPIYKNPNCTINHPGSSCNIACGEY